MRSTASLTKALRGHHLEESQSRRGVESHSNVHTSVGKVPLVGGKALRGSVSELYVKRGQRVTGGQGPAAAGKPRKEAALVCWSQSAQAAETN